MTCCNISIEIPEKHMTIHPNNKIKLGRFKDELWEIQYGWYSFGGNRPTLGWYLTSMNDDSRVKPLHLSDLDDIYLLKSM